MELNTLTLKDQLQHVYNEYRDIADYTMENYLEYGDYEELMNQASFMNHFGHIIEEVDKMETNRYALSDKEVHNSLLFGLDFVHHDEGIPKLVLIAGGEVLLFNTDMAKYLVEMVLWDTDGEFGDIKVKFDGCDRDYLYNHMGTNFYKVYKPVVEINLHDASDSPTVEFSMYDLVDSLNKHFKLGNLYEAPDEDKDWDDEILTRDVVEELNEVPNFEPGQFYRDEDVNPFE